MVSRTALVLLAHAGADLEEVIAALCLVATVSHALREFKRRDEAVDAVAELTTRIALEKERIAAGLAKHRRS
jgi:hypothetical protein